MLSWVAGKIGAVQGVRGGAVGSRAVRAAALSALVLGGASGASAQSIFSDSFESGNGTAWHATKGQVSYPSQGCHSGRGCGSMTLSGGSPQQSVLWERNFRHDGSFYMAAWYRFPVGYTWDPAPGANSTEHKMFIVNVGDSVGRILVNLRGGGTSPTLQMHFERLENRGGISQYTQTRWPADGQWHFLEMLVDRRSGTSARAQLWLDGRSALDATGAVCGSPCSPIVGVQMGAFVNQGASRTQTFFLDDAVLASSRQTSVVVTPTPTPTPAPTPTPTPAPTGGYATASCANGGAPVCEGFESRSFAGYDDVRSTGVLRFSNTAVNAGGAALEARIEAGTLGENFATRFIADHPLRSGGPGAVANEIYLRSKVRYGAGFDMAAGKLFIVNAFDGWNAGFAGPNSFAAYYVTIQTINGEVEALLHSKTSGDRWRPLPQNQGARVKFATDRWYDIGVHLKLNTPGRPDGVAELYIDGVRKAVYTDVNFRDSYTRHGFNHVMISPLQQSAVSRVRSQYYDEWVVSSTPIGNLGYAEAAPRQRASR